MTFKKYMRHYVSVLSVLVLAGCGGGGGSPATNTVLPVATFTEGVYVGALNSKEFISVVTPELDWFSLYFSSAVPEIYSGRVISGLNQSASIPTPGVRAFQNGHVLMGGARFTGSSTNSYNLTIEGFSSLDSQSLIINATTLPAVGTLPGIWTGTWTDSLNNKTLTASVLRFSESGATSNFNYFTICEELGNMPVLSLTPLGVGTYSVKLEVPRITGCDRTPSGATELNGVAFLHASTSPGKTLRLDLIAIDSTGSGVSFRGDR